MCRFPILMKATTRAVIWCWLLFPHCRSRIEFLLIKCWWSFSLFDLYLSVYLAEIQTINGSLILEILMQCWIQLQVGLRLSLFRNHPYPFLFFLASTLNPISHPPRSSSLVQTSNLHWNSWRWSNPHLHQNQFY